MKLSPPPVPSLSRRRFLGSSAATIAATSLPDWFLAECRAATPKARIRAVGPNETPAIALVGCGGMGTHDARLASTFGRIVAVCDVDADRLAKAKQEWPDAAVFRDFREIMARNDIHAVICGTVDHWHTLVSIAAMKSRKDVYCEKPLTLTVDEGKHLVKMQRSTGQHLQTGSQQRSDARFRLACELVRNQRIGKLQHIDVWLPAGRREGPFMPAPVPDGLHYDMWLGQTPKVSYVKERTHGTFRYWWEYSGGTMTDWGAHHHDIALWGAGLERTGPVSIEGWPTVQMIPGGFTASSEYEIHYSYANGVTQRTRSTPDDDFAGGVVRKNGQRHGVRFRGADGWIWVTRGEIQASHPEILATPLDSKAIRLYASDNHMGNFFEAVHTRKPPICDVEIGHRSASVCHLGVIALRLGRKLRWDPAREKFVDDRDADKMLVREMRKPWNYDFI